MFRASTGIVGTLPDSALTTSHTHSDKHHLMYVRIGDEQVTGKAHGWCGVLGSANEITVDLTTSHIVTGIATQGRGDSNHWVTDYSVETSEDGHNWMVHGMFRGNFDRDTICRRRFDTPVLASFVKFTVENFYGHPCMRLDVLVSLV